MAKIAVAPHVGAWIEIWSATYFVEDMKVAPLVGAWIEIDLGPEKPYSAGSLPSWERGLKYADVVNIQCHLSRSPRGSVD